MRSASRLLGPWAAAVILAVGLCGGGQAVAGDDSGAGQPLRESDGGGSPLISFIDSPTSTCYQDPEAYDTCYVEWAFLHVTASTSQYILRMTVEIDGRLRAVYSGFFQGSMTVPSDMHDAGFKVACGEAGAGGDPELGAAYAFTIRAEETGGLTAANYGTVYCPARLPWQGTFEDGFESGDTSAWSSTVP
jgi:hypothetical protein